MALLIMVSIFTISTIGYSVIEDWSILDSAYMTVITLTTIGFQEVHPLSDGGRFFTIIIVISSITALAYTANLVTRLIASGEMKKFLDHRRKRRFMDRMEDHYIICGFGRIGRRICELFKIENVHCIVVDRSEDVAEIVRSMDIPVITGEATEEAVLREAGLERAKCIITAVDSPADNVFITLTARDMNPGIHIVSRGETPETGSKLMKAGADRVVYPHQIGGRRMAMAALRPTLDRFMSMDELRNNFGVYMEEIHISENSELVGLSLMEASINRRFGLNVIAILGRDQMQNNIVFNPGSHSILQVNDALIVLGTKEELHNLEDLASGR